MTPRLTQALDFNTQALVLRAERQRLIANNIANADTPGFQARDFDFAQAMRVAAGEQGGASTEMGRGIARFNDRAGSVAPLLYARPAQNQLDNNTVDMDRERAAFVDNAVKYEATLRFLNGQLRTLQDAMKSPSQA